MKIRAIPAQARFDNIAFSNEVVDGFALPLAPYTLAHAALSGPVNLSSPTPLPYADFMRTLREAWGTRIGLPATEWMVEIGTRLLGTERELVLKSRRVVPGRLLESGFTFDFPTWPEAAKDLCRSARG